MADASKEVNMQAGRSLRLYGVDCEASLCEAVLIAHTPWQRLRGLLGRPQLQPGEGLLLLPSKGIHTFGMRYAIDAVLLDASYRVIHVYEEIKPGRIRLAKRKTHCVLELPSGQARRAGIHQGDCLRFEEQVESVTDCSPALLPACIARQPVRLSLGLKLLLTVLLCLQCAMCWSGRVNSRTGQVDLRAYYAAGMLARTGAINRIYDDAAEHSMQQAIFQADGWRTLHFLYPPFAVLPFIPLSLLSYSAAVWVVLASNLGAMYLCAWLLVREHPEWKLSAGVLWVFYLCFFPTAAALLQGQVSFVLLLVVTLFYCLERRGRPVLAGLCLAVGLVKFQVVLPMALLYLLWRRYRVVAGFAVGAVGLFLLSLALTGVAGLHAYVARLGSVGSSTLLDQHAARLRYAMLVTSDPNLHGLATLFMGRGTGGALVTAALSLVVLVWSVRQKPSAATATTAALLLSYHLQLYGLPLLLLPLTLLVMELKSARQDARRTGASTRAAAWLMTGSILLLSPPLAYWFVLRGNIVWYVLASIATLPAIELCTVTTCPTASPNTAGLPALTVNAASVCSS
ncbi:MAG: glycosyltransferase 87 family protein [Janthinobacterium lividum]